MIGIILKAVTFFSGVSLAVTHPEESAQVIGAIKYGITTGLEYVVPLLTEVALV